MDATENSKAELLQKYVTGSCSMDELRQVAQMYEHGKLSHYEIDAIALESLNRSKSAGEYSSVESGWEALSRRIGNDSGKSVRLRPYRKNRIWIASAAAVILLLVSLGAGLLNFYQNQRQADHLLVVNQAEDLTATTLLTSTGELISSDSVQSILKVIPGDRSLFFAGKETLLSSSNGFNRLMVPFGKTANVLLSDGSKVWLNAGSTLAFSASYDGLSKREVYLTGEAYFEVSVDAARPFRVITTTLNFSVLGTTFNINVMREEQKVVSVLETGSLLIEKRSLLPGSKVLLTPGEKSEYHTGSDDFSVSEVNTLEYTSWKDGYLLFNNHSLGDIAHELSGYYNLNFIMNDSLANNTLVSGKLLLTHNSQTAIQVLCDLSGLKYEKDGRNVVLKR